MPRKKISKEGLVAFAVKIPRETWKIMRGELAHYNWPVIVRGLLVDEVERLMALKSKREDLVIE